jgi:hypothetical protein
MTRTTSVCLKLEGITGASPQQVVADAIGVADRVLCMVEIEMNGVTLFVMPGHDPEELRRIYEEAQATRQKLATHQLTQLLREAASDNQPL